MRPRRRRRRSPRPPPRKRLLQPRRSKSSGRRPRPPATRRSGACPSPIVFQKYLNANDGDLAKAKDQLTKTLEWRAETKPLDLLKKEYSKAKFEGLGYVTSYGGDATADPEQKEVFTWNIYGGVKSMDETFGKLEE